LTIRRKSDGANPISVPVRKRPHWLTADDIPNPGRPVITAAGQFATIRRKRHSPDGIHVPFECADFLAPGRVPNLGGVISGKSIEELAARRECDTATRGDELLPVRRKSDRTDAGPVSP